MTEYVTTLLKFLHMFLRKMFEDAHKYRIFAYIISKKEDGNKGEKKYLRFHQNQCE